MRYIILILSILLFATSSYSATSMIVRRGGGGSGGTEYLYPDGNGAFGTSWTANGSCTDYDCVSGTTGTYTDTEYLSTVADFQTHSVTMQNTSASSGQTITSVTVYWRLKDSVGDNGTRGKIGVNGSQYDGPRPTKTTSFAYYSQEFTTNPEDSQAWTSADIDTLECVAYAISGTNQQDWSHCYAEVVYE